MLHGIITKGIGGFYYIKAGDEIYECKARGKFRAQGIVPMVGDKVEISIKNGKGAIEEIYPRVNSLIRPAVANITQLVVVAAILDPVPNKFLIDSFLVMGEKNNLNTALCINKSDLADADELRAVYEEAGYRVICASAENGDGVDELKELLKDKITAFAGNSGVGKSSLLNELGLSVKLKTGSVSDKIKRGRHTTRHVELLELEDGGFVLDTPGFSTFELPDIKAGELENYFIEFEPYIGSCRFRGCAHVNEPDCAVRDALVSGKIVQSRYDSYTQMYEELKKIKHWKDKQHMV